MSSVPGVQEGSRKAIIAALIANGGILVAAMLAMDPSLTFEQAAATNNDCEARLRAALPSARVVDLEPDTPR